MPQSARQQRVSVSRVVPAIPLQLTSKRRPTVDSSSVIQLPEQPSQSPVENKEQSTELPVNITPPTNELQHQTPAKSPHDLPRLDAPPREFKPSSSNGLDLPLRQVDMRDLNNGSGTSSPPAHASHLPPPYFNHNIHYPNGHAYHLSEPFAAQRYPPSFPQSPATYSRDYFNNNTNANQRPFFQQPQRHPIITTHADDLPLHLRHPAPASPLYPLQQPQQYPQQYIQDPSKAIHPALIPPQDPHSSLQRPDLSAQHKDEDAAELISYIRSQFGNRQFADCIIHVSHAHHQFHPTSIPCHAMLLSRSPKLSSIMAMEHTNPMQPQALVKTLSLVITDKFLNNESALVAGLTRLYGEPLPTITQRSVPPQHEDAEAQRQMRQALAYAAAGHFLQMEDLVSRGLDLATKRLKWSTIDIALSFALEGGLSYSWSQSNSTSEGKGSISSFDDNTVKLDSETSTPAYGYYSDQLLHNILNFIIDQFPSTFTLSTSAPQLCESPRLPTCAEPQHIRPHTRRMSHIRFGDLTEPTEQSSPVISTISSILISLPFPTLRYILDSPNLCTKLGSPTIAQLSRAIIDERESRRRRAITNRAVSPASTPMPTSNDRLWATVGIAESIENETQAANGIRLVRHRLGAETPTSGGSANSQ